MRFITGKLKCGMKMIVKLTLARLPFGKQDF